MTKPRPFLCFFPYLPLGRVESLGEWLLGPVSEFDSKWCDEGFKRQALAFFGHFRDAVGRPIENPTLVARKTSGVDGTRPSDAEIKALQSAVQLAALDRNPRFTPDSHAWNVVTADECEFFVWPINLVDGYVTTTRGSMMRESVTGGWRISDDRLVIGAPLEIEVLSPVVLERDLLEAAFKLLHPEGPADAAHLRAAAVWQTKAWRNTPSIRPEDRVVFLKTGFEALVGESKSRESARLLRELFDQLKEEHVSADELLWSPGEKQDREWRWTDKSGREHVEPMSDTEHWFMAFSAARNRIIHEGQRPTLVYNEPGSAYNGHFVWTGEWLLRAAIKVEMARFGFPDLWRPGVSGAAYRAVKKAIQEAPSEAGAQ